MDFLTKNRGVMTSDGACLNLRSWGPSKANALYWRKYLWHCWDFSATPVVIRHLGNCPHSLPLVAHLQKTKAKINLR